MVIHEGDTIATAAELRALPVGTLLIDVTFDPLVKVAEENGWATWDPTVVDRTTGRCVGWVIFDDGEILGQYGPEGSSPFLPAIVKHIP